MITKEIQLNKVVFKFQESASILRDISLTIKPSEFIGIVGPNGSGKTTLARLLNGNLQPTSGTLFVDGLLSSHSHHQLAIKRLVTLIGSDPENQLITSTVFDEITFALQAFGLDKREIKHRSEEALDIFNLRPYRDTHPFYLSVGEKFRVLIAAGLVRQPRYIILDEITSMMDSHTRHTTLQMLLNLRTQGKLGVVLFTHRLDDLLNADRIIVLQNGQIKMDGTVDSIFAQALTTPDWNIEIPFVYQICRLLPPKSHEYFPELSRVLPDALFERIIK